MRPRLEATHGRALGGECESIASLRLRDMAGSDGRHHGTFVPDAGGRRRQTAGVAVVVVVNWLATIIVREAVGEQKLRAMLDWTERMKYLAFG